MKWIPRLLLLAIPGHALLLGISCSPSSDNRQQADRVSFVEEVKPLLESQCLPCHHGETLSGGLNLESGAVALRPLENGSPIVPGNAERSLIYIVTGGQHGKSEELMPADGILLSPEQRTVLKDWIDEGAPWPDGPEGHLKPLQVDPGEA